MATQLPTIYLGSPGEDIGIRDLQEILLRFKSLHETKEQQVWNFLEPKQRKFLDLLALIFHCNLPLLPGFISTNTPAGIEHYSPSIAAVRAAQQFSKNFQIPQRSLQDYPIEAVFLMGSVGSIAFSKSSDIDIWVCHTNGLPAEQLEELQKKATAVEEWAASLDLEVHIFLMDSKQFLLGEDTPLSSESSGKTQHYLLLEEFYRTAIYIAGRSPAWWLVPLQEEKNYPAYIRHLQDNRFVYDYELIDFGGFNAVPAEEFISATLWHIYKSLYSPHKSLLKLLLMECYASEYPDTKWLCQEIKQAVYNGDFGNLNLDPYLLIYKKVEEYLQKQQSFERLELVRQCFYLKIMGSTSNALDTQTRTAREKYMADLAKQWRWPAATLNNLRQNQAWNIIKATQEHTIIIKQLTHCYQVIMRFANEHIHNKRVDTDDLKLIGRKLHAFLEKKPGKIEIITTRSAIHSKEAELSIVETQTGWALYRRQVHQKQAKHTEPIQKFRTLIEVFGWLVINELYHKQLLLHFSASPMAPSKEDSLAILADVNLFIRKHFATTQDSLSAFQHPRAFVAILVIVNLGMPPTGREDGKLVLSERSDVLSYGMNRESLVESIDCLYLSSWGELTTAQYVGIEGLFDCLLNIINNSRKPLSAGDLTIVCRTPVRAKSIMLRVQTVCNVLLKLFAKNRTNQANWYILAGKNAFYLFYKLNQAVSYRHLPNPKQVLQELASPQKHFRSVYFDQGVLENTPVPLIYSYNKPKIIQLFYAKDKNTVTIYILDERGALFSQTHQQADVEHLLSHYTNFLEAILVRNLHETLLTLEYYEIQKNSSGVLSCSAMHLKIKPDLPKLTLRITGEINNGVTTYTAYCNEREFSSLHYGNQVFNAVYQYILQFRASKIDYPVYINDIDLPLAAFHLARHDQLQTIHFLNYKQKIEAKLNT